MMVPNMRSFRIMDVSGFFRVANIMRHIDAAAGSNGKYRPPAAQLEYVGATRAAGRFWGEGMSRFRMTASAAGAVLLLMLMIGTATAAGSPAETGGDSEIKAIAARLNQSGRRLLGLRQDLQQILASDVSKDINSLSSQRLIMDSMSLLATRFQCEAKLMGVALLIRREYADFYRRRRFEELEALKEIADYTLESMRVSYGKVTNNAALHMIDMGFDAISRGQDAIERGLKYYLKK